MLTTGDLLFILQLQLPPLFNLPKSQLQCFGESVYCMATDMLSRCNSSENPHDRFIAVVAWSISTVRPLLFGVAPYNPILGETHHVSRGNFNVLLEQVLLSTNSLSLNNGRLNKCLLKKDWRIYFAGFTSPTSICPPCN